MPRAVDTERKPSLLAAIIEYFEDKPLSGLSFRTLAQGLGVSSYTLVYHFGTKEKLLDEIVRAIAERQKGAESAAVEAAGGAADRAMSIDTHLADLKASFDWALNVDNLKLQRLEFEAAMIEAIDPEQHTHTRKVFAFWMEETVRMLRALGLDAEQAALESRVLNNSFYGFQYDLVVNRDPTRTSHAFDEMLERHRAHLKRLLPDA